MSASSASASASSSRSPFGRSGERSSAAGRWATAAAVVLAVKFPLVVVGVTNPDGIAGVVPPTEIGVGLFLSLAFLASSIVFLLLRHWFGAVSAIAYGLYTLVGGSILIGSYPLWGAAVAVTSALALAFTIVAIVRGAFRARSRTGSAA